MAYLDIITICNDLRRHKPLKVLCREHNLSYQVVARLSRGDVARPHDHTIPQKLAALHKTVMQNQTKQPTAKNAPLAVRGSL